MEEVFAYFDGDNIGSRLELLLIDDQVEDARSYSASVNRALSEAQLILTRLPTVEVILAGGDDLLARWTLGAVSLADVEAVRDAFLKFCGQSLSVGVGQSAGRAAYNLRRAKLLGKAQAVSDPGLCDGA